RLFLGNRCFSNNCRVIVVLLMNQDLEFVASHFIGIKCHTCELAPQRWLPYSRRKGSGEIRQCLLGRLRWCEQSKPTFHLKTGISELSNRRHIGEHIDPCAGGDGKRPE